MWTFHDEMHSSMIGNSLLHMVEARKRMEAGRDTKRRIQIIHFFEEHIYVPCGLAYWCHHDETIYDVSTASIYSAASCCDLHERESILSLYTLPPNRPHRMTHASYIKMRNELLALSRQ